MTNRGRPTVDLTLATTDEDTVDPAHAGLTADGLSLGYGASLVVEELSETLPTGRVSAIVGPNGCGKSTLLRGLGRLLTPRSGQVILDGARIARLPPRTLAQRVGLLPQQPLTPDGVTVVDLVGRGRHPHQKWFRQWSRTDEEAVADALAATGVSDLAHRPVDELSGGQRQRVWIALALAQDTDVMLLDEPTTFLDLAHQVEVLDLLRRLNRDRGRTVILVLHDLNLACRYADHLVVMRDGAVAGSGPPTEVITPETVRAVFDLRCEVIPDPLTGTPLVLPRAPIG
ncbi:ABC transporter ATP-binding protein [Spiractinospora alimapuensis]|uniref:ABC transporter ATP-binding protein n=1 Tax=Spiractinospora alimapuensis TaxID=2820884 RepID=UPI001F3877FB|nr:ABC transporter ATP-binding protein [Spiractinospora alimapuensis]QVQ51161.1 ABC transporter ATP-binding protein [Spiractinospora alimapuensis]